MTLDQVLFAFGGILLLLLLAGTLLPGVTAYLPWLFPRFHVLHAHYMRGEMDRALAIANEKGEPNPPLATEFWNSRICVYIAAGRYREALHARPFALRRSEARRRHPPGYALAIINRAEALYNLGRWRRAESMVLALFASGLCANSSFVTAGAANQLAWILAATGRADVARWLLEPISPAWLPHTYVAEAYFTLARVELAAGELDVAEQRLELAEKYLVRVSSERNALFLRARLKAAQGHTDEAIVFCRQAAEHSFRTQGGDGLLLWGDMLRDAGRIDEAKAAWQLACERDPESESAGAAATRLEGARADASVPSPA